MNNNILSSEEIEKICRILHMNQNKINLLRNDLTNNNERNNNKLKINQFLNGLEIDIKNILLLLERMKIDLNTRNQNCNYKTYCLNNDKNMLQDILICGCCEYCKCNKCCDCSANNCSEIQQLNVSNTNQNQNDNEYIKERINDEDNNNKFLNNKTFNNSPYFNNKSSSPFANTNNNNLTYPNFNLNDNDNNSNNFNNNLNKSNDYNNNINNRNNDDYNNNNFNNRNNDLNNFNNNMNNMNNDYINNNNDNNNYHNLLNPNNEQNFSFNNNEGKIIYSQFPSSSPSKMNNNDNIFQKPFGYIKKQNFNNIDDSEDKNLPIEEKIKNSAVVKSKRFHPSKSFDSIEVRPSPRIGKAKIINSKKKNNYNDIYNNNKNNNNDIFNNNDNDLFNNDIFNNNKNNDIYNNNKIDDIINPNRNNENNLYHSDKKNNNRFNKKINPNNLLNINDNDKNNKYNNNKYNKNRNNNNNIYIDDDNNNNENIYNNKYNEDIDDESNNNNNNNNLGQKKKKMEKMNKIQIFLNKLYRQPEEIANRFKKIYGDDIEVRLLNGDIDNNNLTEMDNILNKIIKMSIWGEEVKDRKKSRDSNSYDKKDVKRKHYFVYNPIQEKIKLMKSLKNKQAYFREFPRGWYSTKEYFINNGTDINNENVHKYV